MAYETLQSLIQGNTDNVNIGGKSYSSAYANDVNNQEEIRNAVVNANNNISYTNKTGTYDNVTNQSISPMQKLVQQPQVVNNSSQITDMYNNSLSAAQSALKASIQASMGTYKDTIAKAPGTFQPLRDQASYGGAKSMQNLLEMEANNGQQGGVNRTEQTQVNSNTENNINSLNQQQQSVIDTANKAIADLQAQGDIKGAELVAQNASERIRALIEESNRVDSLGYSRGRDTIADTRYNTEYADQRGDVAYNRLYQTGRDNVQDTGRLQNGEFTQSGAMNDINMKTGEAQLRELTDPNSTTNQMAKLGLDTAKLNYAALPEQLKGQAQLIAQQLSKGSIDIKTAQVQLDYLPRQMQAELNQTYAQTSAANRSNTGGSGGGGSSAVEKEAKAAQPTTAVNTSISKVNSVVNGSGDYAKYTYPQKIAFLDAYSTDLATQTGVNAAYMIKYVAEAKTKLAGEVEAENAYNYNKNHRGIMQ